MVALLITSHDGAKRPESNLTLAEWVENRILSLKRESDEQGKNLLFQWWDELDRPGIFILNKMLTGSLRVGVSESLTLRALEELTGKKRSALATKLLGEWTPSVDFFHSLFEDTVNETSSLLPKPFCLASPLQSEPASLGSPDDWIIEWKWDGIRAQIVKCMNQVEIWSRGEERVTDSFPDLVQHMNQVQGDWILDGEILAGDWQAPYNFSELQKRLNRKKVSTALLKETPASFLAYDILQLNGQDLLEEPLASRKIKLAETLGHQLSRTVGISEILPVSDWQEAADLRLIAREKVAEGLMLKKKDSIYELGRKRGVWFKWKLDPLSLDLVLTAAQPGTGRRAALYTDYTFSIWNGGDLVNMAKAYSGLTDEEIRSLDAWIRKNTTDRFGPVRGLKPVKVFEIGFEGLAPSKRHKSGFALRFPRILRERVDKPVAEANQIEDVRKLWESLLQRQNKNHPESPTLANEQLSLGELDL
jgi:DNA ligase-1